MGDAAASDLACGLLLAGAIKGDWRCFKTVIDMVDGPI